MYPVLLHLGPLILPTFGVLAAAGLMAALALSERTAPLAGVQAEPLWNAGLFAAVAAFVFSRALLVAENWRSFRVAPLLLLAVPSLTASGLLLTAIAVGVWLWWKQLPWRRVLDAWAPCAAVVWGCLALGHFAEGSDVGMPTAMPWGVRMPGSLLREEPVALLAAAVAFALALLLYAGLRRGWPAAGAGLLVAGAAQVLLSFVRLPSELSAGQPGGLDPIEWAGVGMVVAGGFLLASSSTGRRPGTGQLAG